MCKRQSEYEKSKARRRKLRILFQLKLFFEELQYTVALKF